MRAQISIEYLIVLGIAAIVLISAVAIFPQQLRNSSNQEAQAQAQLKELKLLTTAASTSQVDYQATMPDIRNLGQANVDLQIRTEDNTAVIRSVLSQEMLGIIQLPNVTKVTGLNEEDEDLIYIIKQDGELTIRTP